MAYRLGTRIIQVSSLKPLPRTPSSSKQNLPDSTPVAVAPAAFHSNFPLESPEDEYHKHISESKILMAIQRSGCSEAEVARKSQHKKKGFQRETVKFQYAFTQSLHLCGLMISSHELR